jgi:hypothetical protein
MPKANKKPQVDINTKDMVRFPAKYCKKQKQRHAGFGRVISIRNGMATIKPPQSRFTLDVPVYALTPWKSRNAK